MKLPFAKPPKREKPPRQPINKVSAKRLAKLGKTLAQVYNTIIPVADLGKSRALTSKPRPKAETERAHGPEERREWTKRQPCIVPGCGRTPCDAAHLINGGMSRKADARWTVPFCSTIVATGYRGHHDEYDGGKRSFLAKYFPGLERAEIAAQTEAAWQSHVGHSEGER